MEKILQPYLAPMINLHNLPKNQKLIWLIDSWSVHKSSEFLNWIKSEHANVLVLFVPSNSTSKLQPADVILQRPLKHAFKLQFHKCTTSQVRTQIEVGKEGDVDLRMSNLKPLICEWLHNA